MLGMKFRQLGPHRVRINLSRDELDTMGLSYDMLDYSSARTRALLFSLLEKACADTGFKPAGRVLVEAYPDESGGCRIEFSGSAGAAQRWRVKRSAQLPVIYAFDDVDTLIACAVKLFGRCAQRIRKSALYHTGKNWMLAVYPARERQDDTLMLLDEFARRCGEGALAKAWLSEHARTVVDDNAVGLLCAYFG